MSFEEFVRDVSENWQMTHDDETTVRRIIMACHEDGTRLTTYEKEEIRDRLEKEHNKMVMMGALTESDNSAFLAMVQKLGQAIKEEKK